MIRLAVVGIGGYGWDLVAKMRWYGRDLYSTGLNVLPSSPDVGAPVDLL